MNILLFLQKHSFIRIYFFYPPMIYFEGYLTKFQIIQQIFPLLYFKTVIVVTVNFIFLTCPERAHVDLSFVIDINLTTLPEVAFHRLRNMSVFLILLSFILSIKQNKCGLLSMLPSKKLSWISLTFWKFIVYLLPFSEFSKPLGKF